LIGPKHAHYSINLYLENVAVSEFISFKRQIGDLLGEGESHDYSAFATVKIKNNKKMNGNGFQQPSTNGSLGNPDYFEAFELGSY
jgi:hypothetical protein